MSSFLEQTCTKTLQVFMQILLQLCCSRDDKPISFYLPIRKKVIIYE